MPGLSCAIETARLAKRQAWWLDDIHLNQKYPFLRRVVRPQGCVLKFCFYVSERPQAAIYRLRTSSGSFAIFAPILRASSLLSNLAATLH
jgi:hypothetical protein